MSLDTNQRIVYSGLSRMTDDRNTITRCFNFWQKKLSSRDFKVPEIVAYIEKYMGLSSAEKKTLFVAMQAASSRLPEELPVLPGYLIGEDQESDIDKPAEDTASKTPHRAVTEHMFNNLAQHIFKRHSAEFHDLTSALLEEDLDDISEAVQAAFKAWADNGLSRVELPKDIKAEECGDAFRAFAGLVTEFIGPVNTDRLINVVISDALNLTQASQFDPRQML